MHIFIPHNQYKSWPVHELHVTDILFITYVFKAFGVNDLNLQFSYLLKVVVSNNENR